MDFIVNKIDDSNLLDELSSLCVPRFSNFPPLGYFSDYIGQPNNHSVHFKFENDYELVIIGEKNEETFISTSHAFVACPYVSALDFPFQAYEKKILDYFSSCRIKQIRLRTAPEYISNPIKLFSKSGLSYRATTSIVELSKFSPSKRRMRSIGKAQAAEYIFEICNSAALSEVWNFLATFLESRSLPTIDFSRIFFLTTTYPELYFLASVRNAEKRIIAAAFISISGHALRIPNYFGLREYAGSTDFLLWSITEIAISKNLEYLDLGISSDPSTGVDVIGIVNYKSEFSAERFDLYEEVIDL